mgnify:CR=1 FL=1
MTIREVLEMLISIFKNLFEILAPLFENKEEEETPEAGAEESV